MMDRAILMYRSTSARTNSDACVGGAANDTASLAFTLSLARESALALMTNSPKGDSRDFRPDPLHTGQLVVTSRSFSNHLSDPPTHRAPLLGSKWSHGSPIRDTTGNMSFALLARS